VNKRIIQVILISCILIFIVSCIVYDITPQNDEERFQAMRHASALYSHALSVEHGRWGGFFSIFHRSDYLLKTYKADREALFASGFLTNLTFRVPAEGVRRDEWIRQETVLTQSTNVEVAFPILIHDSQETITCRTQDAAFLSHNLGE
jgi:hypothetical protein